MTKYILAVITALTAAILMACGGTPSAPIANVSQPTQVDEAQPEKAVENSLDWTALKKAGPSYWTLSTSKAFKSIEYGCTLRWKATKMDRGCVVVIDRVGGGYLHNGLTAPMGVVVPRETGVTIYPIAGKALYVEAQAKTYSFVVIDETGAYLAKEFKTAEPEWDDKLLTEYFIAQMGGNVETIWREGVSDQFDN